MDDEQHITLNSSYLADNNNFTTRQPTRRSTYSHISNFSENSSIYSNITPDISLDLLFNNTYESLFYVLILQSIIFVGTLVIECIFFRWYILVSVITGIACLILGYLGSKYQKMNYLYAFYLGQYLGIALVFMGTLWVFQNIAYYSDDCNSEALNYDCPTFTILGIAAAASPILFILFLLGIIYSKRLYNIMDAIYNNASLTINTQEFLDTDVTITRFK